MPRPVANPPNPWRSEHVEYLGEPPDATLEVYEEDAGSVLSRNDSSDIPFRYSVNPYRGCFHACAYCYARPFHELLGWGAGTDFDRRIVVKRNAAAVLDRELSRRGWQREVVAFSGVTDCYQPLEASYGLTRACLQACLRHRTPVSVITKGALVERDRDLLAELHRTAGARVHISVPFADDDLGRAIEPFAPPPSRRLRALAALAEAGVPVGVAVAPVICGLNDDQVPRVLRRAREAGAETAFAIALRLPGSVEPVFFERLQAAAPLRAKKVRDAIAEVRGGRTNDPRFGHRMRGLGPRWSAVEQLFEIECRRLGLRPRADSELPPARPRPRQGRLF